MAEITKKTITLTNVNDGAPGAPGVGAQILRATNEEMNLDTTDDYSTWEYRGWRKVSGNATITQIEITDCPDANCKWGWQFSNETAPSGVISQISQDAVPIYKGKKYTLSCWIRCINETTEFPKFINSYFLNTSDIEYEDYYLDTTTSKWVKYVWTFTPTVDSPNIRFGLTNSTGSVPGDSIQMTGFKLEEGSVATSWCENELDRNLEPLRALHIWDNTYEQGAIVVTGAGWFNRLPKIGEIFTNLDKNSRTGIWKVIKKNLFSAFTRDQTVVTQLLSFVNSKGATGATGAAGASAEQVVAYYCTNKSPKSNELSAPTGAAIGGSAGINNVNNWYSTISTTMVNGIYKFLYRCQGTAVDDNYQWGPIELYYVYDGGIKGPLSPTERTFYELINDPAQKGLNYDGNGILYISADYINTGVLRVGTSANKIFEADITNDTLTLAGFNVDNNSLYIGSQNSPTVFVSNGSNVYSHTICGYTAQNWCFGAGSDFGVTEEGTLYCNNAVISGALNGNILVQGHLGSGLNSNLTSVYIRHSDESNFPYRYTGNSTYSTLRGSGFQVGVAIDGSFSLESAFIGFNRNGVANYPYITYTTKAGGYNQLIQFSQEWIKLISERITSTSTSTTQIKLNPITETTSATVTISATDSTNTTQIKLTPTTGTISGTWTSNSAVTITSDINKKNSIEPLIRNYDSLFNNLLPKRFKYNDGTSDRYHLGFIAQEVTEAIYISGLTGQDAALVCEFEEEDDEGNKTTTYGLRYEELISLCVDQIQKLKSRIQELESKFKLDENLI